MTGSIMHAGGFGRRAGVACLVVMYSLLVAGAPMARAADGPSIIQNRVYVRVKQSWHAWVPAQKKFLNNTTSWFPELRFAVSGPVPSGSQFVVEFTKPAGAPWHSVDCPTDEVKEGDWSKITTPTDSSTEMEKKFTTGTGVFGFKIRLTNELTGQNKVLYTGRYKVGKVSKYNGTPVTKNQNDYYVDYDWVLPFAYLWFEEDRVSSQFVASMWFKGQVYSPQIAGYLFHNGKQIGSTKDQGSTGTTEEDLRTISGDKGDPQWTLWSITWYNVAPKALDPENPNDKLHYLDKNPGTYEIKILRGGKLTRTATFTVGEDGKIVDALNSRTKLNSARITIPVKVMGALDGVYAKAAGNTEAFHGNPLAGFVAP